MKGPFRVITFSHELNDAVANLENDCQRLGVPMNVLGVGEPWNGNTQKLRLLRDFVTSLQKAEILLVIDAYDVRITGTRDSIFNKIDHLDCDILFGAEANFLFKFPDLKEEYWDAYPRKGTYHYLNSGTLLGESDDILTMLKEISSTYQIDIDDDMQIASFQCDQSLFSRYYVDIHLNKVKSSLSIELDTEQNLFGCSGGTMAIFNFPIFDAIHQYCFFREERKLIKTFHLRPYQIISRDLKLSGKKIFNKRTGTTPEVIHLPGTQTNFDTAWRFLTRGRMSLKWHMIRWVSLPISLIAYFFSFVRLLFTPKP